jgi:hypothetical protein
VAEQTATLAISTLASGITNSASSLTLNSPFTRFPTSGDYRITISDEENFGHSAEVCNVSGRSSGTLTLSARGQEGTTARAWSEGATVKLTLTKAALMALVDDAITEAIGGIPAGAPTDAEYVVKTAHAGLSAEQAITGTPTGAKFLRDDYSWQAPAGGASGPTAKATNSTAQAIANNTVTAVTFNSEEFDPDNIHSTSSNTERLTPGVAGYYLVVGVGRFVTANATGRRAFFLYKNGTGGTFLSGADMLGSASQVFYQSTVAVVELGASDYVVMGAFQNSGISLDFDSQSLAIARIA